MSLVNNRKLVRNVSLIALAVASASGCLGGGGGSDSGKAGEGIKINGAPSIEGAPPETVLAGDELTFEPEATDPDGDKLTFTIENKPEWAEFDKTSGMLAGTPGEGHVGEYPNIRITATDGENTASVVFSILVSTDGDASVSVSWTPPTEYEDGTPLTDLAGFYLYYGTEEGQYDNMIEIDNPSISTYVVDNLVPNRYYFVARSYTDDGLVSRESNVAVKDAM